MSLDLRYEPGPAAVVDLSDNTNLWGTPPAARAALLAGVVGGASRYPLPYGDRLKEAAADYLAVQPDQVVTGCGSDDLLDSAIRSVAPPGQRLAFCGPTFAMIPALGRVNRLKTVAIPFRPDWEIAVDELLGAEAAVTYICAPNNPTATGVSRRALEAVVQQARGVVIVDEAYAEYAGTTAVDLVDQHERLLVVRTLSKAFGLAGLRVGYAVGNPELVRRVELARGPFKVTSLSEAAAVAALTADRGWVAARVEDTLAVRRRFESTVAALPAWELLPSQANFVLARPAAVSSDSVPALDARLRARGVAGRVFLALPGIGDAIRFTIGPWVMMAPVIDGMAQGCAP